MAESKSSRLCLVVSPNDLNIAELKEFYKPAIDACIDAKGIFHISDTKVLKEYFNEKKYAFSLLVEGKAPESSDKATEIIYMRILGKLKRCTSPENYPIISLTKNELIKSKTDINQLIKIWKRSCGEVIPANVLLSSMKTILPVIQKEPMIDAFLSAMCLNKRIAFGRRKPESKEGCWTGACVLVADGSRIVIGVFEDSMDHILNCTSLSQAITEYLKYVEMGWVRMTDTDVTETSGVSIDDATITEELLLT